MRIADNAHFWGVIDETGEVEICSRCNRVREWIPAQAGWVVHSGYKAYQKAHDEVPSNVTTQ